MAVESRGRTVFLALLAVFVVAVAGAAYANMHDRLWNTGPVNAAFHSRESPDAENSVGVTSEIRALFPDGTPLASVSAALAGEGFVCEADASANDTVCRRKPFTLTCSETWFVRYAAAGPDTVNVTHASKSCR